MSSANDMEKVFKDCSKMADNTSRVLVLKFLKTWLLFAKAHVLNFHLAKEQRKLLDEEYKEATRFISLTGRSSGNCRGFISNDHAFSIK